MFEVMKCLAEGIATHGVKGLLEMVPGGKYAHDIGAYAIKRYREKKAQKKLEDAVKEVIVAKADEALAEAKKAVEEAAPQLGEREKELVAQYLAGLPEAARQSLKRKEDPTGSSLPFGFTLHEPDDVVKLLPCHPPRFVPGEWVPGREDNWRLERRLGSGGFGEVWLARHHFKRSEKPRAVKFCTNANARTKLVTHEKQLVVRVMERAGDHPNIVPLLECHLSGETPWLMYEYVAGGTLADAILEWEKLVPAERLNRVVVVLHAIAGAVGHCHAMDPAIVHRDLKPANILMEQDVARITDFGIGGTAVDYLIAEESTHGYESVMGRLPSLLSGSYSLMYSSPQQRNRERPDPRDDVHALGVIAYQMLVGRVDAEVKGNWHRRLKSDGVPEALIDLIGASASDDADSRPADAREWEVTLAALRPVTKPRAEDAQPDKPVATQSSQERWPQETPESAEERVKRAESVRRGGEVGANALAALERAVSQKRLEEIRTKPLTPTEDRRVREAAQLQENLGEFANQLKSEELPSAEVHGEGNARQRETEIEEQKWQITVPGKLYSLPAGSKAQPKKVTDTPAEVTCLRGKVYSIVVWPTASDSDLAGFSQLGNMTSLHSTVLKGCKRVTDEGLTHLAKLRDLRDLQLVKCAKIAGSGLAYLKGLASLKLLWMTGTPVTDSALVHLSTFKALSQLSLGECKSITDAGIANLGELMNLTELIMSECQHVTDAGLNHLQNLSNLRKLFLRRTSVTDAGLAYLKGMTRLETLGLDNTHVTDAGLAHLRGLTALQHLTLNSCKEVTDAGLTHLERLTALEVLELGYCEHITDVGLASLKNLKALRSLKLSWCKVTDAGLASLKTLRKLHYLNLDWCRYITDQGLKHLQELPALSCLDLGRCELVTEDGIAAFKKVLPKCHVQR